MKIYRSYTIHAARFIPTLDKDHPCSKMHGHTFKIIIELDGPINSSTGFVMDFNDIERKFMAIKKKVDHNYLNDIEGLENPTSEVLIEWIWNKLKPNLQELTKLVLWENEVSKVEFSGN